MNVIVLPSSSYLTQSEPPEVHPDASKSHLEAPESYSGASESYPEAHDRKSSPRRA